MTASHGDRIRGAISHTSSVDLDGALSAHGPVGGIEPNGAGDDVVTISYPPAAGSSTVIGGAGTDTLIVNYGADTTPMVMSVAVNNGTGGYDATIVTTVPVATITATSFELFQVITGTGSDSITLGGGADTVVSGSGGADTIDMGAGIDTLVLNFSDDANAVTTAPGPSGTAPYSGGYSDGAGRSVSFSNVELINIATGSGNDDITVRGPATVSTGTGDDAIRIGGDMTGSVLQAGAGTDTLIQQENLILSNFTASSAGIEQYGIDNFGLSISGTASGDIIDFAGTSNIGGSQLNFVGLAGADSLGGSNNGDILSGGADNDTLSGNGGADLMDGGADSNTLNGGTGADTLVGETGHDVLNGNDDNDTIYADQGLHATGTAGSGGLYTIDAGAGDDTIAIATDLTGSSFQAGSGSDLLQFENTSITLSNFVASTASIELVNESNYGTTVNATAASDTIDFTGVSNIGVAFEIDGKGGADSLFGTNVTDTITGGAGNDTLGGNDGADSLDGNAGNNSLSGGTGADTLVGEGGHDTLNGNDDNDVIYADQGLHATSVVGTSGLYTVDGGAGDDTVVVAGVVTGSSLQGGVGTDLLQLENQSITLANFVAATAGFEQVNENGYGTTITATAASDVIDFTGVSNIGVSFEIDGQAGSDSLFGTNVTDTINGGGGNDTLGGNDGADLLDGNAGDNSLTGGAGADTLVGETGHDILNGGADNDTIYADQGLHATSTVGTSGIYTVDGGTGDDTVVVAGNVTASSLQGGAGTDTLVLENQQVTLSSFVAATAGFEQVTENNYNSTISGTASSDVIDFTGASNVSVSFEIDGLGGNDSLFGTNVADVITGGDGNDTLGGNDGADVLNGNAGTNSLSGGAGADTLIGENGHDVLNGNDDNDLIFADQGLHSLGTGGSGGIYAVDGGAGDDTIAVAGDLTGSNFQGGAGNDTLQLESQTLTLSNFVAATAGIEQVTENNFGTTVNATVASDTIDFSGVTNLSVSFEIDGQAGNDSLFGTNVSDTIKGGGGNDTLGGNGGDDLIDGEAGTNTASYAHATGGVTVDLNLQGQAQNTTSDGADNLNNIANLIGSQFADTLTGDGNNNALFGGVGADTLTGNGGGDTLDGGQGADSMVGGAGNDVYVVDNNADKVVEGNNAGADTVQSSITYTLGNNVENLVLTANGPLSGTGNGLANSITGNIGANTLDGGVGADTLVGGQGDDTYLVDNLDTVTENANEGTDTVQAAFNYTLGANLENLTLLGAADLTGTGNTLANLITGNTGSNTLDGGAGVDTLVGAAGNDTYLVDNAADVVTEAFNQGTDTVQASINYTLSANVENLTLVGSAATGTGNGLANLITGDNLANTLDGAAGADTLNGGLGDDTYLIDDAGDAVNENAGEGTDTVKSSINYTLGANLENLVLLVGAATGTGNSQDNTLTGNTAANTLDGGQGSDTLVGGQGDDTYLVDAKTDVVTENANEGTDTVRAASTYTLGANVENLVLTGAGAYTGVGNNLANTITANDTGDSLNGATGNDTLNGGLGDDTLNGGSGADSLAGGAGADLYIVDNIGDVVTEALNAGLDTVQSSISFTLGANLENLLLTGSGNLNGIGNGSNNEIDGNSGANSLQGGNGADTLNGGAGADTLDGGALSDVLIGGAGADSMMGGLGSDTYYVDNVGDVVTELAGGGVDTVQSSISYTLGAFQENLTLTGTGQNTATGNGADNVLRGNGKDNTLNGGLGNDTLSGGQGHDTASYADAGPTGVTVNLGSAAAQNTGSAGTDTLTGIENLIGSAFADMLTGSNKGNRISGGDGADTIVGGHGGDVLTGGADADVFRFNNLLDSKSASPDRITDLQAIDTIDLHGVDADTSTATDDAFHIVGAFTKHAGELVITYDAGTNRTSYEGDVNGDKHADFTLLLDGDQTGFTNYVL